jgi:hypothetical protein
MEAWAGVVVLLSFTALAPAAAGQVRTASLNGTVTDESKAVLPGATVTATEAATGRPSQAVTDERGEFHILSLSPGIYRIQAELSGFATVVNQNVELLVGQNATLHFSLKLASVQETVTVSGQAPLVDTQSSAVSGNVDRRQMENMPLQGRNWLELSTLVKGVTANNISIASSPMASEYQFQINLDGQQVTQKIGGGTYGNQGKVSRDAIAEFQIVTNLFDITQGRSVGIQIQAITKAGTNTMSGSAYGYFRDDKLNAADFVAGRVLPYENQQLGASLGGPLVRDKMHFFGSYEYEREPFTVFSQPPQLPGQTFTFDAKNQTNIGLGRFDYQMGGRDHLTIRTTGHRFTNPFARVGGTTHPSNVNVAVETSANILGTWTRVFANTLTGEFRAAFNRQRFWYGNPPEFGCTFAITDECRQKITGFIEPGQVPTFQFPGGLIIGPTSNLGQVFFQNVPQFRYDMTWLRGSHTFKFGGEWLRHGELGEWHFQDRGTFLFHTLPPDLTRRFPADAWNNPARWDIVGLEPYVQNFTQNFHTDFLDHLPRAIMAGWFGDTWRVTNRLTVNYGVRWDDDLGITSPPGIIDIPIVINNALQSGDFGYKSGIRDHNNFGPRGGFAHDVGGSGRLVIRGGSGVYFASPGSNLSDQFGLWNHLVSGEWAYDNRPGFLQDPRRGVRKDQLIACNVPANCQIRVPPQAARTIDPNYKMSYTWQNSVGFQKQLGATTGFDVDAIHWIWYNDRWAYDPNLFYDPVTGYNKDPRIFGRPNPAFGQLVWNESNGQRDYLALAGSLTRRLHNNFQLGLTDTVIFYQHDNAQVGGANNDFDHQGEWARSTDFQRHTLRAYGIYQLPWRVSVSGAYFYGSGNYFANVIAATPFGKPGQIRLNTGAPITIPAAVADRFVGPSVICTGCVMPRNALRGLPLHRVDLRFAKDVVLPSKLRISLIAEVFNLFNHENYGDYVPQVNTPTFGQPRANPLNAYAPRRGQLAVHMTF